LTNLETALGEWDGPVEVVHRSYILDPSIPSDGVDMMERMVSKMGSEERVKSSHARVAQAGAQYGLEFDFDSQKVMPQTAHTHAVVAWAPVPKRRALVRAIHDAHFLQGKNIGNPQVLGALAGSVGLDAAAATAAAIDPERLVVVRAEARSAQHAGVRGVPHIVIGDRVLRGAQPPAAILQAISEAAAAGATAAK
jgi:predicted DsbA family dithiol-disulfide isomerase